MTERGFYHPDRGYWQTIGEPSAAVLADYPNGTSQVPIKPGEGYEWNGSAWVAPDAATLLSAFRETANMPRQDFLAACVDAGIIDQATAEEAADGSWPTAFDAFLEGLTGAERIDAKARWADNRDVWRSDSLLALIAVYQSVTAEQLDAMFGWEA